MADFKMMAKTFKKMSLLTVCSLKTAITRDHGKELFIKFYSNINLNRKNICTYAYIFSFSLIQA